jgi:uncharacterized damage-inducible protein DinB
MVPSFAKQFDEIHTITRKAVRQIPEAQRDFRPVPEMLTAFDLVFHMFSQEKVMLVGCRTGRLELKEFRRVEEDKQALRTVGDLARYGEQVHRETQEWLSAASPADLRKSVETFIGPGTPEQLLLSALVHIVHHRGQLYVYLRLMGIEPVFVWSGEPMSVVRGKLANTAAQAD